MVNPNILVNYSILFIVSFIYTNNILNPYNSSNCFFVNSMIRSNYSVFCSKPLMIMTAEPVQTVYKQYEKYLDPTRLKLVISSFLIDYENWIFLRNTYQYPNFGRDLKFTVKMLSFAIL